MAFVRWTASDHQGRGHTMRAAIQAVDVLSAKRSADRELL